MRVRLLGGEGGGAGATRDIHLDTHGNGHGMSRMCQSSIDGHPGHQASCLKTQEKCDNQRNEIPPLAPALALPQPCCLPQKLCTAAGLQQHTSRWEIKRRSRATAAVCTWTNASLRKHAWLFPAQFAPRYRSCCGRSMRNGQACRGREGLSFYKPKLCPFVLLPPPRSTISFHPPHAPISVETFPLALM